MAEIKTLSVKCPTCKKEVLMTKNFPQRPFCSQRCQLIDLGEWASEKNVIEGRDAHNGSEGDDIWSDDY